MRSDLRRGAPPRLDQPSSLRGAPEPPPSNKPRHKPLRKQGYSQRTTHPRNEGLLSFYTSCPTCPACFPPIPSLPARRVLRAVRSLGHPFSCEVAGVAGRLRHIGLYSV